jgi:hypothetical protein
MWVGSRPIYILMNGMKKKTHQRQKNSGGGHPKKETLGKKFLLPKKESRQNVKT